MMVRRSQTAIASSTVFVGDTIPGLDRRDDDDDDHGGGDDEDHVGDAHEGHGGDNDDEDEDVKIIMNIF